MGTSQGKHGDSGLLRGRVVTKGKSSNGNVCKVRMQRCRGEGLGPSNKYNPGLGTDDPGHSETISGAGLMLCEYDSPRIAPAWSLHWALRLRGAEGGSHGP